MDTVGSTLSGCSVAAASAGRITRFVAKNMKTQKNIAEGDLLICDNKQEMLRNFVFPEKGNREIFFANSTCIYYNVRYKDIFSGP